MKKNKILAALTALLVLAATSAQAANLKIGYVDLQRALQETSAGKKAKGELETEFKKKKNELQEKEAALKKQREDIQKKKDLLSESALQQKAAEFQQEMFKYQQQVQKSQVEIQTRERSLTAPILKQLGEVINSLAKEKGYDMILEKSQQGIVWAKKEMDLTKDVVKAFEKKTKK